MSMEALELIQAVQGNTATISVCADQLEAAIDRVAAAIPLGEETPARERALALERARVLMWGDVYTAVFRRLWCDVMPSGHHTTLDGAERQAREYADRAMQALEARFAG